MAKSILLPLAGVMIFLTIIGLASQGKLNFLLPQATKQKIAENKQRGEYLTFESGTKIKIEIADTDAKRTKGLSNRQSLDEDTGMLFVMEQTKKTIFWMKDTLIPLDIIWIKNGVITGIEENVKTEIGVDDSKLKRYQSPGEVDFVLEVNAGFSSKNGIKPGQKISGLEQL